MHGMTPDAIGFLIAIAFLALVIAVGIWLQR